MGLDATAYKGLKLLPEGEGFDGEDELDDTVAFYINPQFPKQADDILGRPRAYSYEDATGNDGYGYGAHSRFREILAQLAGYPEAEGEGVFGSKEKGHCQHVWNVATEGPFYEFINFSDCEGVIGPKTSAKLAEDFKKFRPAVDARVDQDTWFKHHYGQWQELFETAAETGAVKFH